MKGASIGLTSPQTFILRSQSRRGIAHTHQQKSPGNQKRSFDDDLGILGMILDPTTIAAKVKR